MSLMQRMTGLQRSGTTPTARAGSPRSQFPKGVFAALQTTPADLADDAYAVYRVNHLTPGIAEREVARVLQGANPICLPVEASPGYAYDVGRECTTIGRARVFAYYLVRMQVNHESNQQQLRILRDIHRARRVRVLPGCCEVCDRLAGRTWRLNDAPDLPVRGCLRHGGCRCAFVPE